MGEIGDLVGESESKAMPDRRHGSQEGRNLYGAARVEDRVLNGRLPLVLGT